MMVIITGASAPSDPNKLQEKIATLRSRGVDVLVVGVGELVNIDEIQQITSDDKSVQDNVLLSKDYSSIVQFGKDISEFACSEGINNSGKSVSQILGYSIGG